MILSLLVPAEDGWPAAGEAEIFEAFLQDVSADKNQNSIGELIQALPADFEKAATRLQIDYLETLESNHTSAFASLLRHTYNAYYSNSKVLKVLEAKSGYPARPPLFQGYEMEPFDPGSLKTQQQRAPFWRKTN
ncbi:MAG: hypothetical protein GKR93_10185 [Gammaproteobacteria bacterium]|nr:hypothetical protein [Gammaproteobacteria bacterium]